MSKLNCSNCKYYDFNAGEGVDWCKLNHEETGICGNCDREFEDLEEATTHYDAIVEENNTFLMENSKMASEIKSLQKQIADLEAKLAESEKQIKDVRETANMSVDSWCKNRRKYEAQIAEMQNKSFILYSMLYETLEKQGCENVASQIDQMTGWTYDKEADWLKGNRNYDQLKQQLTITEKALELACEHIKEDLKCDDTENEIYNYFKTQAKE